MDKRGAVGSRRGRGRERLLLSRVLDRMEAAQRRQEASATGFLSRGSCAAPRRC